MAIWRRRLGGLLPDATLRGARVLDVGCGSGELSRSLADRGALVVAIDLTARATNRAHVPGIVSAVQCDALALPFRDDTFDHSLSMGVLHHTPDCHTGLREMVRVTRNSGILIIALYSKWTPYHLIYLATSGLRARTSPERLHRLPSWAMRLTRAFVTFQIRQELDDEQLVNVLADQFWTPRASFHSPREIRQWAKQLGLRPIDRRWHPFYLNEFAFQVEKPPIVRSRRVDRPARWSGRRVQRRFQGRSARFHRAR